MTDLPPQPFRCVVELSNESMWIRPIGELDMLTAAEVNSRLHRLRSDGCDRLVLDLRRTTFIDSSGMNTIVAWHHRAVNAGFGFDVVQGPRGVRRVFEITGVDQIVRFVDGD